MDEIDHEIMHKKIIEAIKHSAECFKTLKNQIDAVTESLTEAIEKVNQHTDFIVGLVESVHEGKQSQKEK